MASPSRGDYGTSPRLWRGSKKNGSRIYPRGHQSFRGCALPWAAAGRRWSLPTSCVRQFRSLALRPGRPLSNLLGDAGYFSRRSLTLLLVVALHVALFFALMNGLVTKVHKIIEQPIVPRIIDPTHPQDLPPPPRPALEKLRMIDIPTPVISAGGTLRRHCQRPSGRS